CSLFFVIHLPPSILIYTLSLHDALPISGTPVFFNGRLELLLLPENDFIYFIVIVGLYFFRFITKMLYFRFCQFNLLFFQLTASRDRKSTRLNSSHVSISYAVFCLKKKK